MISQSTSTCHDFMLSKAMPFSSIIFYSYSSKCLTKRDNILPAFHQLIRGQLLHTFTLHRR